MLLELNPKTSEFLILRELNNTFLKFLQSSIDADNFSDTIDADSVCWTNEQTREKFEVVFNQLAELDENDRRTIYDSIHAAQAVDQYFSDTTLQLPQINDDDLFGAIKVLTKHLFENTKKLVGIRDAVGQSVNQHFASFQQENQTRNLCPVCATEYLAQRRSGMGDEDQWLAAYDHLLCKTAYPYWAVHPKNILPTCHTCNSKAKGAKDLIFDENTHQRRTAFYPYNEHCCDSIRVKFAENQTDTVIGVKVQSETDCIQTKDKISVWEKVYQVPERIEGTHFNDFMTWIQKECWTLDSFVDFERYLELKSQDSPVLNTAPFEFWDVQLYHDLHNQDESVKHAIWAMIDKSYRQAVDDISSDFLPEP